jgi:hypothetical protein
MEGVQSSCFPVSISSYLLPLLGGSAFSLLVMPALSWQQGFFCLFSYGLWWDGYDPGVLAFLPYSLPGSFFMLHTSKLAMQRDTRVLVQGLTLPSRSPMLRWFVYVDTAFLAHHTFSVHKALRVRNHLSMAFTALSPISCNSAAVSYTVFAS